MDDLTTTFGPVPEPKRIGALDALRGVAIFGIFMVNIGFYAGPLANAVSPTPPTGPEMVSTLRHAESRAISKRISNASPNWRPEKAVLDIERNKSPKESTSSSAKLSSGTKPSA